MGVMKTPESDFDTVIGHLNALAVLSTVLREPICQVLV